MARGRSGGGAAVPPIGARLRAAREEAGLSLRELAALLEVSPATVSDAEKDRDLRHSTLRRYAKTLPSLSAHVLLGGDAPAPPLAAPGAWAFFRDAFGFSVRRLRFEVEIDARGQRTTRLEAAGARPSRGDLGDPRRRAELLHHLFHGSAALRPRLGELAASGRPGSRKLEDACFVHELRLPRSLDRTGLSYLRHQIADRPHPPELAPPGTASVSAPFDEGVSFAVGVPAERLEILVRFRGRELPGAARACCWTDLQSLAADEPDFAPFLHAEGLRVARNERAGTLRLEVNRPVFGLQYGFGWAATAEGEAEGVTEEEPVPGAPPGGLSEALRAAREAEGFSQRELALRLGVSPVTVAGAERGQDLRRSHLLGFLRELPQLRPELLLAELRQGRPWRRQHVWEHYRALIGIEADEERKTLVITPEGDAHAVCESLRLRRVRPSDTDLRIRYGSASARGKRLPTQLRAIEEKVAAQAEETGLKTRAVARRQGRLIHEIIVPAERAQEGASYTRRLFNARFFDPDAEDEEGGGPQHDGAAIVPFHAVKRLFLSVKLPPGHWPEEVAFRVHPRMILSEPLPEADLAELLHPEGLSGSLDPAARTLTLTVHEPLIGFMYEIWWAKKGTGPNSEQ